MNSSTFRSAAWLIRPNFDPSSHIVGESAIGPHG